MNKYMNQAKQNADTGIKQKEGGPFGAVITDKDGNIIANGNNRFFRNLFDTNTSKIVNIVV